MGEADQAGRVFLKLRINMERRHRFPLVFLTLAFLSPVWAQTAPQSAGYPTRSTTENLAAKRYVVAGDRAYIVGTQDGSLEYTIPKRPIRKILKVAGVQAGLLGG